MQKKSGQDMVLKTMKYVTAMTYRWALGWWQHLCGGITSPLSKGLCQLGGMGWLEQSHIMIIKVSVIIIDSVRWEQKMLVWLGGNVLGGCPLGIQFCSRQ